jgi:hypothetical protein
MANPERGEVSIDVGGELYTLKLTINAAATLQGRHKKPLGQILKDTDDLDVVAIRGILWALLQKHHAAAFKNEEAVGPLMDEAGIKTVLDKIAEAFSVNSDPNPLEAQATEGGTSGDSTLTPSASA